MVSLWSILLVLQEGIVLWIVFLGFLCVYIHSFEWIARFLFPVLPCWCYCISSYLRIWGFFSLGTPWGLKEVSIWIASHQHRSDTSTSFSPAEVGASEAPSAKGRDEDSLHRREWLPKQEISGSNNSSECRSHFSGDKPNRYGLGIAAGTAKPPLRASGRYLVRDDKAELWRKQFSDMSSGMCRASLQLPLDVLMQQAPRDCLGNFLGGE